MTVLSGCLPGPGKQKIAFASNQGGSWAIYVIELATNEACQLTPEGDERDRTGLVTRWDKAHLQLRPERPVGDLPD